MWGGGRLARKHVCTIRLSLVSCVVRSITGHRASVMHHIICMYLYFFPLVGRGEFAGTANVVELALAAVKHELEFLTFWVR